MWSTYRAGQCEDLSPSSAYCDAARAAVLAVAQSEGLQISGEEPELRLYDLIRPETFKLTLFPSVGNSQRGTPVELSWEQLCYRFANPRVRAEKDGQLFSAATFRGDLRRLNRVIELSMLVFDNDHNITLDRLRTSLEKLKCAFAIYSTHSHRRATEKNPDAEPRYRTVIPLSAPVPAAHYGELWQAVVAQLGFELAKRKDNKIINSAEVDNIVKNLACIYYTPVKASPTSAYEYHVNAGPMMDWHPITDCRESGEALAATGRSWAVENDALNRQDTETRGCNAQEPKLTSGGVKAEVVTGRRDVHGETAERDRHGKDAVVCDRATGEEGTIVQRGLAHGLVKVQWSRGNSSLIAMDQLVILAGDQEEPTPVDYLWREERHAELCRRIMARGRQNQRGNWDAKCLAHGGKGNTGLCYYPHSQAVACNAGCDYYALLRAEGLSDAKLPPKPIACTAEVSGPSSARTIGAGVGTQATAGQIPVQPVTAARLHSVYGVLLAHLLFLNEKDAGTIVRELNIEPYGGELIEFPDGSREAAPVKMCTIPTATVQEMAAAELSKWFDLAGVPGFYLQNGGQIPGQNREAPSRWSINFPSTGHGVLAPYTNGGDYIIGIRLYMFTDKGRNISAPYVRAPFLLTSAGLRNGAKALQCTEEAAA